MFGYRKFYSLVFGKAETRSLAAPIGISVISSFSPFGASISGSSLHKSYWSMIHEGTFRPIAFTSIGVLATVNGKLSAGHSLRTTLKSFKGLSLPSTNA